MNPRALEKESTSSSFSSTISLFSCQSLRRKLAAAGCFLLTVYANVPLGFYLFFYAVRLLAKWNVFSMALRRAIEVRCNLLGTVQLNLGSTLHLGRQELSRALAI